MRKTFSNENNDLNEVQLKKHFYFAVSVSMILIVASILIGIMLDNFVFSKALISDAFIIGFLYTLIYLFTFKFRKKDR